MRLAADELAEWRMADAAEQDRLLMPLLARRLRAFATALACHLALDRGIAEAALLAKTYVTAAIAAGHPLGRGPNPVHHLYRMSEQRRAAGSGSSEL